MELILESGLTLKGEAFGFPCSVAGELVFNTGMTGYAESMTDPSYYGQILVFTYPLIGNYGIPKSDFQHGLIRSLEAEKIQVKGIVVAWQSADFSHHAAWQSLDAWMVENKVPGIAGIDTRALTQILRDEGVGLAKLLRRGDELAFYDPNLDNLVAIVSPKEPQYIDVGAEKTIVLVDTGAKAQIFHQMLATPFNILRVPWDYDYQHEKFDGVLLPNGPGDPSQLQAMIRNLQPHLGRCPILGICLGHQVLSQALGATTYKLKYGHRSHNQPCVEVGSKKVIMTSQNHGYAVETSGLPKDFVPWFFNANDGSNEGIRSLKDSIFSVQFHPEATPGPLDAAYIFDLFRHAVHTKTG